MTEKEFQQIVSSTKQAVLGAIHRYLSYDLADLVDDVAQETYVRIYRYLQTHGFDEKRVQSFNSFAYVIARNESIRMNKKNHRITTDLSADLPDSSAMEKTRLRDTLASALEILENDLRSVVGLKSEGYSTEEIARLLGLPAGTVKSRMHRARVLLRERSAEWFG